MPTLKDFDEMRKRTVTNSQQPQPAQGSSLMPSGESMAGGMLGSLLGPAGSIAGSGLGAAVARLRHDLPALLKIGVFGPMGSEGVAGAMGDAAMDIGGDVAKNAALNAIPGAVGTVLSKTGRGLTAAGEVAGRAKGMLPTMTRMAVGPILHSMGVSEAPALAAEAASVLGPAAARKAGPLMERAGEALPSTAMQGLRNVLARFGTTEPAAREPLMNTPENWDPAGPSLRAKSQASQQAAREAGSGVDMSEGVPITSKGGYVDEPVYGAAPEPTGDELGASGFSLNDLKGAQDLESAGFKPGAVKKIAGTNSGELTKFTRNAQKPEVMSEASPEAALAGLKKSIFQQMNDAGEFGGDRTTGQFDEGEGGLGSIARQPTGRPNQSPGGAMADMEEGYGHGLTPDLWQDLALPEQAPLTPMQRLAARAQERFGVKYR